MARSRGWQRRAVLFGVIFAAMYGVLYAGAEWLVWQHGARNRFFMVAAAAPGEYDTVILGASHAMPMGFEDINARLEAIVGGKVINLSVEGAGIVPNRLLFDDFRTRHGVRRVLYVADAFAFRSRKWNEERLEDVALFRRAPTDLALLITMLRNRAVWPMVPGYASGFYRINNPDPFATDMSDAELNLFHRVWRPNAVIDRQRLAYLYPRPPEPDAEAHYLAALADLADAVAAEGGQMILVKPPLPERVLAALPREAGFDAALIRLAAAHDAIFCDFAHTDPDAAHYYNTDHLNRDGVLDFVDRWLAPLLRTKSPSCGAVGTLSP